MLFMDCYSKLSQFLIWLLLRLWQVFVSICLNSKVLVFDNLFGPGTPVLLLLHHYLAFNHFSKIWYDFNQVLAYFTICLWIVPFALLVSLSANDNVLPTTVSPLNETNQGDDIVSSIFKKRGKRLGLLSFLRNAQDSILPQRVKKSFWTLKFYDSHKYIYIYLYLSYEIDWIRLKKYTNVIIQVKRVL